MFKRYKTVRLKKIKDRRLRGGISSKLRYLLEKQGLYDDIDENNYTLSPIVVKYKKIKNEVEDVVLIIRFIKSGSPLDIKLPSLHGALETVFDVSCGQPVNARKYVQYTLILTPSISDDSVDLSGDYE